MVAASAAAVQGRAHRRYLLGQGGFQTTHIVVVTARASTAFDLFEFFSCRGGASARRRRARHRGANRRDPEKAATQPHRRRAAIFGDQSEFPVITAGAASPISANMVGATSASRPGRKLVTAAARRSTMPAPNWWYARCVVHQWPDRAFVRYCHGRR